MAGKEIGFIHRLSPRKRSCAGNPYFDFNLQMEAGAKKVIAYGEKYYDQVKELSICKSPVKLVKIRQDDKNIIINEESRIEKVAIYDINFEYQDDMQTSSGSKSIGIKELKEKGDD